MKNYLVLVTVACLLVACDTRVNVPAPQGDKTTIIVPPDKKEEHNTTIVTPPAKKEEPPKQ